MTNLIQRLFGLSGTKGPSLSLQKRTRSTNPSSEQDDYDQGEPKSSPAEYFVSQPLNPYGFYAIKFAQAEMYDLGNIDFITHFVLYDRKENIAVDVTHDVQPAPLLSATRPAEVLPKESIESLEKFLTGEIKPEFTRYQGICRFLAQELTDNSYLPLRERMVQLRDAQVGLDLATNAFREQAKHLRTKYLSSIQIS